MKAALISDFGDLDQIQIADVEEPSAGAGQVKIAVHYAGLNPVDWKITAGYLVDVLEHKLPIVLGWDVAGTVVALGEGVTEFAVGDPVYSYCRKPVVHMGCFADFVCFDAEHVAAAPNALDMQQAAAVPLVGLTAWQAIHDVAKVSKGQNVLIHAGAGGVGSMAIQFAKLRGANVITTASPSNHDYVRQLGADIVIDYNTHDVPTKVLELFPDGLDFVFDCVGGKVLADSFQYTKKNGWLITICEPMDKQKRDEFGIQACNVFVRPNGSQLREIALLFDAGKLVSPAVEVLPFNQVKEGLARIKQGHVRGKLVLQIKDS